MNEEIRRRVKVVSSFPDEDSAMKIFYLKSIEFRKEYKLYLEKLNKSQRNRYIKNKKVMSSVS